MTTEIFEMESENSELKSPNFPPNYQTLSHNYSKHKLKENLVYKPMTVLYDESPCEYSKYIPKASSSGVSILGPPPTEKGLSRRARKAIRKESLQNFDFRPSFCKEGQSSQQTNIAPDVISRMEKQIQLLSRQFQQVNAKLNNTPIPSVAPMKNKQKQILVSKKSSEPKEQKIPKAVKRLSNRQAKKVPVVVSPVEAPTPPVVEPTVPIVENLIPPSSDPNLLVFGSVSSDQVSQNPYSDGFSKMN